MFRELNFRGAVGALGLTGVLAGSVFFACANDHKDIARPADNDPANSGITPPIPTIVFVEVGEDSIRLEWSVPDPTIVSSYSVYRASVDNPQRELARGLTATAYVDREVRVGQTYQYQVASVLTNGLEGQKSESTVVSPAAYNVSIDGGSEYSRRTRVSLSLTAPAGTANMRYSEMSDLSGAPWVNYSPGIAFDLDPGPDGLRTVYAQFRDTAGNVSAVVSDSITLDTISRIDRVTQDAGSDPVPLGTTVRFTVETTEPGGTATIDIGSERFGIRLFDDGTQGDGAADDGVYTVDYTLPRNLEVREAEITGRFTDAAGNGAEPQIADDLLTVSDGPSDPDPVTATLVETSTVSVTYRWTQATAAEFDRYDLLKATADAPGVFSVYKSITTRSTLSDTDFFSAVPDSTFLFYKVEVFDNAGNSAESNVITAPVGP